MNVLKILFGDLFDLFPETIRLSGDAQFRDLADIMNSYRDEWLLTGGYNGSLSVASLEGMLSPEHCDAVLLDIVGEALNAGMLVSDSVATKRIKYQRAANWNKMAGSIYLTCLRIQEVTGIMPNVLPVSDYPVGWDELGQFRPPFGDGEIDYWGGFLWDELDEFAALTPQWLWTDTIVGIIIDLGNDGNYTPDQLSRVYAIVAEEKPAEFAAGVGYVSSTTSEAILLKTVYSRDLSQTTYYNFPDPGL